MPPLAERERKLSPRCLGYFVDNERAMGWRERGSAIGEMALKAPPRQPAKQNFAEQLKAKYGKIESLNTAWGNKYTSWDDILETKDPPGFKDNKPFTVDCGDFGMKFLERYFSVAKAAVKKVAPNNMFVGSRLYGHIDPQVVALAGKTIASISGPTGSTSTKRAARKTSAATCSWLLPCGRTWVSSTASNYVGVIGIIVGKCEYGLLRWDYFRAPVVLDDAVRP
jgi:hypothetical protein